MVLMGNIMILMKRDGAEGVYDLLVMWIYDSVYGVCSILIRAKNKLILVCSKILRNVCRMVIQTVPSTEKQYFVPVSGHHSLAFGKQHHNIPHLLS